ncbi:MAG: hypothetical protein CVU70_03355 [Deltaproteobacteria bacterium HGW-Deltaproteobacteria-5]|nr:MAG: hypothetical protein CVU70_03355 [Deltaproteobacteria bacterium HGW-Deltaproteobacteria-5]
MRRVGLAKQPEESNVKEVCPQQANLFFFFTFQNLIKGRQSIHPFALLIQQAIRDLERFHSDELFNIDVPRLIDGQPLANQLQHMRFFLGKLVPFVIHVKKHSAVEASPGIHVVIKTNPSRDIKHFNHHPQFFEPFMRR